MGEEEDGGASPKKLKMETEEESLKEKDDDDHPGEEEELKGRLKMETEEESRNLSKDDDEEEDHSSFSSSSSSSDDDDEEEESNEIDSDGPLPLLEDMIEFPPPSSTLPPTPPLPSSSPTTDLDMEHQHSDDDDDGPPPGWDNKYQLREQAQQLAVTSAVSSHIQTEDVLQDAHNEDGEPRSQAHPCLPPEVAPTVEEQDSEDDGPPPGWDSKCQPESKLQETPQSDMNMEDVLQDAHNEESQPTLEVPSDIIVDPEDSEDEGPPPGWDSKCQPEPKLQEISQSDTKVEDVLQDVHNEDGQPTPEVPSDIIVEHENSEDEGPPPGWDAKCQPESKLQKTLESDSSDIKTDHVQQDAQNENGLQSQSCSSPATELVPSVEKQDLEDDGPPPGWNSKCQLEPNLQVACPTTPPSDFKIEEVKEHALDKEGSPLGWGSTPQQQSHVHSSLPSPIVQSGAGTGHEPNNVKTIEESPQPPSRQQSIHPMKAQITVPKPPMIMNNPEMGQMVCGSCRHLLTYPRGARYVECACCLEENYVLEEHEVGQVVCGNCNVLLMYPYGAPKVRCANCRAETEIGDQNRRPPLSEHKRRARQHLKRVQAG